MQIEQLEKKHGPVSVVMPEKPRHNWALAFSTYQSGAELEDVAKICEIPLWMVERTARAEEWDKLRTTITVNPGLPDPAKERLAQIEANRQWWLQRSRELGEDLVEIIRDLRSGRLSKIKVVSTKGFVQKVEVPLDLQDRVALVNYANGLANMSYKAIGDTAATGEKSGTLEKVLESNHPPITIILPDVIARPRELRSAKPIEIEATGSGSDGVPPL